MLSLLLTATTLASLFSTAVSQIDPNSVPLATRDNWCQSQVNACPLICLQTAGNSAGTDSNTCDPATLSYSCVCSDGLSPNASEYSQTIPYYVCTQQNIDCRNACTSNNNQCQAACVENNPCGAQNPTRVNATTTTTTSTSSSSALGAAKTTASDGVIYTGFSGSSASPTSDSGSGHKSGAAPLLGLGEAYGLGLVLAGVFTGFTLLV